MGRPFYEILEGRIYCCRHCHTHLARRDDLLSKHFHSKNGKAYLFQGVTNVVSGPLEERLMTTGVHVVADINCTKCLHCVGWRYESAYEESQKYKEGKFILERAKLVDANRSTDHKLQTGLLDDSDFECLV